MKKIHTVKNIGIIICIMTWLSMLSFIGTVAAQIISDNFDSYATGSYIAGQGGWETWGGDPTLDAMVTNAQSYSAPNSLAVLDLADIIHQFYGVNSGMWVATVMVYVPSSQTGDLYFIMLNRYHSGSQDWSVQIKMSADTGLTESLGGTGNPGTGVLPLIVDQWVEIRVEIDLDINQYTVYYDGLLLDQLAWQVSGINEIQCIDLFSDNSSESYFDNVLIDGSLWVDLISFDAKQTSDGVLLMWETAAEIYCLGFNLVRKKYIDHNTLGKGYLINDAIIPSEGSAYSGAYYEILDSEITPRSTYRYELWEVTTDNKSNEIGTVDITINEKLPPVVH